MIATARNDSASGGIAGNSSVSSSIEHLHLHMRRTHWETKHHPDLGQHLQDALDKLDEDGWEVVAAYTVGVTPEIILRRIRA